MRSFWTVLESINRCRRHAFDFAARTRGSVLVETAFVIPVLVLVLTGGIEVSRIVLLDQKIARVAANATDLTARTEAPTAADIDQVFEAVQYIADPFDLDEDGVVIISSVSRAAGSEQTLVNWQRTGAGGASHASRVGTPGTSADLPGNLELREGQALIVGEVFYSYDPFFFEGFMDPSTLYHTAFYRPREVVMELEDDTGNTGGDDDDDDEDEDEDETGNDDEDSDRGGRGGWWGWWGWWRR